MMLFQSVIKMFQLDIIKHKYFCSFPIPLHFFFFDVTAAKLHFQVVLLIITIISGQQH